LRLLAEAIDPSVSQQAWLQIVTRKEEQIHRVHVFAKHIGWGT
jgi:hypothetical protein